MRNDLDFLENVLNEEMLRFQNFVRKNKRRSMAIIEIGAGPVQPLAREFGRQKFLNDKYQTSLISFNPIKERTKHFEWERDQFEKIKGQFTGKLMKMIQMENLKIDIERLEEEVSMDKD